MRRFTLAYWFVAGLLAVVCAAGAARAQPTEIDLLQVVVCEIRELRSVIQQGQILVPLLEANRREREYGSQQLAGLEGQLHKTRLEIQELTERHSVMRNSLRDLSGSRRQDSDRDEVESQKRELEVALKFGERRLSVLQSEEARVSSEAGQIRDRLSRLENEFDRMQRQMQAMATASGSICERDDVE